MDLTIIAIAFGSFMAGGVLGVVCMAALVASRDGDT